MTRLLWPDLEPEAVESGWLAEVPEKVTTAEVLDALARRHASGDWGGMPGRWAFLREVIAETGQWGSQQRFDAVAVGLVPRVEFAWVVYEVKVSRGDWLRELRPVVEVRDANGYRLSRRRIRLMDVGDDARYDVRVEPKWARAVAVANEMWFAAPPRVILPTEVPEGCGLLEVRPWGAGRQMRTRVVVQAPRRKIEARGPEVWAAVLRRGMDSRARQSESPA